MTVAPAKKKPSGPGRKRTRPAPKPGTWLARLFALQEKHSLKNHQMAAQFKVSVATFLAWKYEQREIPATATRVIELLEDHGIPKE